MPSRGAASLLLFYAALLVGHQDVTLVAGQENASLMAGKEGLLIEIQANNSTKFELSAANNVKEVKVNLTEKYLRDMEGRRDTQDQQLFWRVNVNLDRQTENKEGVLSVMIEHGQNTKFFQLPRSSAERMDHGHKTLHDRSVDLCPGENITENSTLRIYIVSSSKTTLMLAVKTTLEFEGEGWEKSNWDDDNDRSGRALIRENKFSFDSPLIHTAFVNGLLQGGDHYVNLRIESTEESPCFCSILSVQNASCPYNDIIGDAKRIARIGNGQWQTVDRTSSMVVNVNKFDPKTGKLLIVLIGADNSLCGSFSEARKTRCNKTMLDGGELYKNVTIRLEPIARNDTRMTATLLVTFAYLVIMAVCLVVSGYRFRIHNNLFELFEKTGKVSVAIAGAVSRIEMATEAQVGAGRGDSVEEGVRREKRKKVLAMTTRKMILPEKSRSRYQKNELFMGGILIVSIFYAVTVLQTAFSAQKRQHETGDYDICYYNSRCQIPLGESFLDFNHFFSNLGYIVFGFTFIGIVHIKGKKFDMGDQDLLNRHGIPYLRGVYYTMGAAIAMEGVMSAAYHICPTTVSFQFDTTYMYLIAILIYVKLYQNRHPDMSANSIQAYLVLGGAIVLEAISIYCQNSATFWTFFCLVYMVSLVFLVANIYQMGSSKKICQNCSEKCNTCIDKEICRCKCKCHKRFLFIRVFTLLADESMTAAGKVYHGKVHKIRPLLLFISTTFCINVALCAYFAWNATQKDVTASNYLLYLFIINMAIYLAYYIAMKMLSGEKLSHLALWYLVLANLCSIPAMWFFVNKEKNSNVTPAESREKNQPCTLLDFYDGHDIWHFLGGAGVFFVFMFIITIDDDIKYKDRNAINVF